VSPQISVQIQHGGLQAKCIYVICSAVFFVILQISTFMKNAICIPPFQSVILFVLCKQNIHLWICPTAHEAFPCSVKLSPESTAKIKNEQSFISRSLIIWYSGKKTFTFHLNITAVCLMCSNNLLKSVYCTLFVHNWMKIQWTLWGHGPNLMCDVHSYCLKKNQWL
jgi:hypothetical protein